MTIDVVALSQALIQIPSVTPMDLGCQDLLAEKLTALGFDCQHFPKNNVSNLWARIGSQSPCVMFAGHTDVVASGDAKQWQVPPFAGSIKDETLYGRGAADMKSAIAAMLAACEKFLDAYPNFKGSLAFLITSAEEGDDYLDGTPHVMAELAARDEVIDYCIIGEPSSNEVIGDVIKIGRRGSLCGQITVQGKQGHAAYPHLADNPIPTLATCITALANQTWDAGNEHFPATHCQVSSITACSDSYNVIPATCSAKFNLRFSSAVTSAELQTQITTLLTDISSQVQVSWRLSGEPFITEPGILTQAAVAAIAEHCQITAEFSTSGGTSDGRFIAPYGIDCIELGLCNHSIHQVDEHVPVAHLTQLTKVYQQLLINLLA